MAAPTRTVRPEGLDLPEGLSGGSLRFCPESLLLYSGRPAADFPVLTQSVATLDPVLYDYPVRARYFHERDHLLRHLSSSYGLFLYTLNCQMLAELTGLLANHVIPQGERFTPFIEVLAPELLTASGQAPQDLARLMALADEGGPAGRRCLRYLGLRELWRVVQGRGVRDTRLHLVGLPIIMSELIESFGSRKSPPPVMVGVKPHDPQPPNPSLEDWPLTAEEVLEVSGYHMEKLHAHVNGEPIRPSEDIGQDRTYTRALAYFLREMGEQLPRMETPIEFHAVLHLALWMPVTPRGPYLTKEYYSWRDFTPGWRFVTATQALRKLGRPLHYHDAFERLEDFDPLVIEVCSDLCTELGWPTPQFLGNEWLSAINDSFTSKRTKTVFQNLGEGHARPKWARALLERVAKEPFSMYYATHKKLLDDGSIMFAGAVFSDRDVFIANPDIELRGAACNLWEQALFQISRFLMEGTRSCRWVYRSHAIAATDQIATTMKSFCSNPTTLLHNLEVAREAIRHDRSACFRDRARFDTGD